MFLYISCRQAAMLKRSLVHFWHIFWHVWPQGLVTKIDGKKGVIYTKWSTMLLLLLLPLLKAHFLPIFHDLKLNNRSAFGPLKHGLTHELFLLWHSWNSVLNKCCFSVVQLLYTALINVELCLFTWRFDYLEPEEFCSYSPFFYHNVMQKGFALPTILY